MALTWMQHFCSNFHKYRNNNYHRGTGTVLGLSNLIIEKGTMTVKQNYFAESSLNAEKKANLKNNILALSFQFISLLMSDKVKCKKRNTNRYICIYKWIKRFIIACKVRIAVMFPLIKKKKRTIFGCQLV